MTRNTTTPHEIIDWFAREYPLVKKTTVAIHIKGLTANDWNRHHYSISRHELRRVERDRLAKHPGVSAGWQSPEGQRPSDHTWTVGLALASTGTARAAMATRATRATRMR
jgi:hypothetical protein